MELKNKTIAVTGATGMLGAYLCDALSKAGARVVGVVRNPDKAPFLRERGVELRKADLNDRDALTKAFTGCDAVISNAALYRWANMSWKDNFNANKTGTENVYEAVAAAGVKRVVHISTFGVYRWHLGEPAIDHNSPTLDGSRRQGGAYRATKQLSEALAFSISQSHGIQTTAIRPAGIYGARDHNMMPYFRWLIRLPLLPVPTFRFPFVHAGDVADAAVGALRNDNSAGKAYLIAGRSDTVYDFFKAFKQASGSWGLVVPLPLPTGVRIDCSAAERDLGFHNKSYVDGIKECLTADANYAAMRSLPKSAKSLTA